MGRKRSPEYDYVCRKCGVACDLSGDRHYRGGRSPRSCQSAEPMLRRDYEAWMTQMAKDAVRAIRQHRTGSRRSGSGESAPSPTTESR